jgi:methionine synthase II (cobalamin-independent)
MQEALGLDVLVHGESERTDMVRAEQQQQQQAPATYLQA